MNRMDYRPHPYQERMRRWVVEHPRCLLFAEMGLGKTVVTLTALQDLVDSWEVSRVLVVAPAKVAESTWSDEAAKWSHLRLRVTAVKGSVDPKRVLPLPWDSEATEATDHEETSRPEAMRRRRELMERMGLE